MGIYMSIGKEPFYKTWLNKELNKREAKVIGEYGRSSYVFKDIYEQEEMYIYKPWGYILKLLRITGLRFAVLTPLSFYPFILFMVPVWVMVIWEAYVSMKWMEKFNISAVKVSVLLLFIEAICICVSPFIRDGAWWAIQRISELFLA